MVVAYAANMKDVQALPKLEDIAGYMVVEKDVIMKNVQNML